MEEVVAITKVTTDAELRNGEAGIVILDLARDRAVGPGSLKDRNHLNIACTGRKAFLIVAGDSMTANGRNTSSFQ